MGVSTDGILAYGYNLGGAEDWEIEQGYEGFSILSEETEDFADAMEDRIKAAGIEGVTLVFHCSAEYSDYILAAAHYTARRGYPVTLDVTDLAAEVESGQYDEKLRLALEVLEITPKQKNPAWILASYWG